jgi:predicted DNA-binding protein
MGSTRVNFRLPEELIQKADVVAEVSKKNRTDIVKEALQEYLTDVEDDETFKEAVVELYLNDQIGFDIFKEFIGRQDAASIRTSKQILDQGEALADELAEL